MVEKAAAGWGDEQSGAFLREAFDLAVTAMCSGAESVRIERLKLGSADARVTVSYLVRPVGPEAYKEAAGDDDPEPSRPVAGGAVRAVAGAVH